MEEKEPFLSRWSRRKLEASEKSEAAAPAERPDAAPPAPAASAAAPEPVQAKTAEYREFFDPQVDEKLRRVALKNLFSDPHFNRMDGLDTYIDDYSIADPIPDAMLRQLKQAKELLLFDEEKKGEGAGPAADTALPAGDTASGAPPAAPDDSASDCDGRVGNGAASPALETQRK